MKNYETPEIIVAELKVDNVIASTFTEGSDNETVKLSLFKNIFFTLNTSIPNS